MKHYLPDIKAGHLDIKKGHLSECILLNPNTYRYL